ncbi:hypothetical protein K491DRAFT_328912 [Lophiostoma macrostomum CBS 122681]|uniref:Uncharacterized protein n=1 Tax=Lophiostoma macrostomum CBS 122681 TaxID=1314788 RepID=A0A6A6TBE7_9PLEO|nr:hypothetical protein K491DRAFT_328912 [Lophiostoma macrostomum CBS 122681]
MLSQDLRKRSQNKLLNKQLSSITNTLTQAAQRRELEIMKKSGPKGINGTPAGGVLRGGDGKVPQPDRATQNKRKEAVDLHLPIQQSSSLKALVEHHEVAGLSMVANGQTTNLDDVVDDRPIDLDALFARLTSGKPNVGQGASTNGSELGDNRTTSFTLTHGDDAVKAPSSPSTSDDATTLQEMLADIERLRRSEAKEMSVSLNDLALTQKPVGLDGTRHSTVASTLDESNVLDELRARVAKMSIAKPLEPLATNTGPQFQIFNGVTNDIPDHVALGSGSMATVDAVS